MIEHADAASEFGPAQTSSYVNGVRLWCVVLVLVLMTVLHLVGWLASWELNQTFLRRTHTRSEQFVLLYSIVGTITCVLTIELMGAFIRRAQIPWFVSLLPAAMCVVAFAWSAVAGLMADGTSVASFRDAILDGFASSSFFVYVLGLAILFQSYDVNRWDGYCDRGDMHALPTYVSRDVFLAECVCAGCRYQPGPTPEIIRCPECDSAEFYLPSTRRMRATRLKMRTSSSIVQLVERQSVRM